MNMTLIPADQQLTNAKGVTFQVGDLVFVKGSKVARVVATLTAEGEARVVRADDSIVSRSAWSHVDRLVHRAA